MKLSDLLKSSSIHIGIMFSVMLAIKKLKSKSYKASLTKSEIIEKESFLLKNTSSIIQQAYQDAGIAFPVSVDYSQLHNAKLNLITQEEFKHTHLNNEEFYLITDSQDKSGISTSWDLYRKFSFNNEWTKFKVSFEKNQDPYNEELNAEQITSLKDYILIDKNCEYQPNMADVYLPLSKKCAVEVEGPIILLTDKMLYAVAAHEAMHAKYSHRLIGDMLFFGGLYTSFRIIHHVLSSLPRFVSVPCAILGSLYFIEKMKLNNRLSQKIEKHADIRAAKELGVAQELSEYFDGLSQVYPERNIASEHPAAQDRVKYLAPYLKQNSLFNRFRETDENKSEQLLCHAKVISEEESTILQNCTSSPMKS